MNPFSIVLNIAFSFLILSGFGFFSGLILGLVAEFLKVKKAEHIALIENALPGLNCGICGYIGCSSYAEEIGLNKGELTLCIAGGEQTSKTVKELVSVKSENMMEKKVTQVHCRGGRYTAGYYFEYKGIKECNAASAYFGGEKICKSGCLAFGSCIKVCPEDAIGYDKNGLVWVNKEKCAGCGKCLSVCPTGVIKSIPYNADVIIACNSKDPAQLKKKFCSVSCIACSICEQQSPAAGLKIADNLAAIDYSKPGMRGDAKSQCPTSCIIENNSSQNRKVTNSAPAVL